MNLAGLFRAALGLGERKANRLPPMIGDRQLADLLFRNPILALLREQAPLLWPYEQVPIVYRCAGMIAKRLSQLPFVVEQGSEEDPQKVTDQRVNVFKDPNPEYAETQLIEATLVYLMTEGECFWVLEDRNAPGDWPRELWPFGPEGWEPKVDAAAQRITGWTYKVGGQDPIEYELHEVVRFRLFWPRVPLRGLAPLRPVSEAIKTDYQAQAFNSALLKNGCDLGGILTSDKDWEEDEARQYLKAFSDQHRGSTKAGRWGFLYNGVKYVARDVSLKDMQYADLRKWAREEAAIAYGIPFEVLGFGKGTYDNFDVADRMFWRDTLVPLAKYVSEIVTEGFVRAASGGKWRVRLDLSNVLALQEDFSKKLDQAQKLFGMGVPLAEVNRRLSLKLQDLGPAYEVGYLPMGLTPVGLPEPEPDPASEAPAAPAEPEPEPATEPAEGEAVAPPARAMKTASLEAALVGKVQLVPAERRFIGKVTRYLMDMRSDVLRRVRQVMERQAPGVKAAPSDLAGLSAAEQAAMLPELEAWNETLRHRLEPVYVETMSAAGSAMARQLGVAFDRRAPDVAAFLDRKLNLVTRINETIRTHLRDLIAASTAEGYSIQELTDHLMQGVRGIFNVEGRTRALRIARTESQEAVNGTRYLVMREAGIAKHKWTTAHDIYVRGNPEGPYADSEGDHYSVDGEVVEIGTPFSNGLLYPGEAGGPASEVINCRCVAVPVTEGEAAGRD